MNVSGIEWTVYPWNPVIGCTKISDGCRNCDALSTAICNQRKGVPKYIDEFKLKEIPSELMTPFLNSRPAMYFLASMGDVFHFETQVMINGTKNPGINPEFVNDIFDAMDLASWHIYQILTNRPDQIPSDLDFSENMWLGTTVENRKAMDKIQYLHETNATTKFLSCEPLLEQLDEIDEYLDRISWVICGGESYTTKIQYEAEQAKRAMRIEYAMHLRDACHKRGIPFFFKQWSHTGSRKPESVLPIMPVEQFTELITEDEMADKTVLEQLKHIVKNKKRYKAQTVKEMPVSGAKLLQFYKPDLGVIAKNTPHNNHPSIMNCA